MKLTETQLDKLKDKFIDRFISDMDVTSSNNMSEMI